MNIIERAKGILLSPASEWPVIEREATPPQQVITSYVAPLAALGAGASLISSMILGFSIVTALLIAISSFISAVAGVIVAALVADGFAPTFGGRSDRTQAFKLVAYAVTPSLVAAILAVVPLLGLLGLVAVIYAIYLLYLGIPVLMKVPADRAPVYLIVIVAVTAVAMWILWMVLGMMLVTGSLVP